MKNKDSISSVIKLVVLQILGIFFFSGVGSCFFRFYRSDVLECFAQSGVDVKCFSLLPPGYTLGRLMTEQASYLLYGIAFGFVLVAVLNLVRKKSVLYLLGVVGLTVLLFFSGAFKSGRVMDDWLTSFGNLFTKNNGVANIIAAICYFIFGVICIWFSVRSISFRKKKQAA